MIPKVKKRSKIPTSLTSIDCASSLKAIVVATSRNRTSLINSKFYNCNEVHLALRKIYGKKCAYCEAPEDEPEIEHYRPKGRLTGRSHEGYYWLCYEWSNLLPACHDCNKTGAKGNYFPIEGRPASIILDGDLPNADESLVTSSNLYALEKPLLLNPEIPGFNPFDYFEFNTKGFMKIRTDLAKTSKKFKRASTSIEVYKLDRYKLDFQYRAFEIRRIQKILKLLFFQKLSSDISEKGFRDQYFELLNQIKSNSNPSKPYSFFWDFVYQNFNQVYITSFFKPKQRTLFFELTNEFKSKE